MLDVARYYGWTLDYVKSLSYFDFQHVREHMKGGQPRE